MGATTTNIFGDTSGAQPATPGSYGERPAHYRLPSDTRLGPVRLQISDLARSLSFYQNILGFRVVRHEGPVATLAAHDDDRVLIELHERKRAVPVPRRGRVGLYHFAILMPDRPALGRFVQHLGDVGAQAGAADHLVSEAFYLQDPDNLGIEVYVDRPRESWRRMGRELMMATDPIDLSGILASAGGSTWTGMPAGTVIGHVHLHVGDIARASAYFSDGIGFDRTVWHYPGALFLGAGGYHHHLGTNIWAGSDAKRPADNEAQMLEWTIEVPRATDVLDVANSLESGGFASQRAALSNGSAEVTTQDPWGTSIRIRQGS